ncbi:MAG TPA: hypothetical protein PLP17_15625, partial [Oligoflexia bacterium]|nr:hypothetical protein [Oligoflexia bacterium]
MFQQQQEFPEADPILAKALQAFLAEKPQGATAYEISTDYNRIVREHKMVQDQLLNYPFDRSISFDDEYFVTSFSVLARVSGYEQKVGLRNAELIREFAKQAEKKFAPEDFYPENPKLRREFIYFMIENGLEDEEREKLGIDIRPGTLEREARLRVLAALEKAGVIPNAKDPVFLQQVEEEKNKMLAEIMSQAPEKVRQLAPEYAASERGRAHQDYLHLFLKYRDLASGNPFARRTSASALQAYSTLFAVLREHNPEAAGRIAADDALIRQGFGMRGPAYDRYYVTEDDLRSVGYPIPARYDARGNRLPRE